MTDFHSNGNGLEHDRPESLRNMLRSHIMEQREFNRKIDRLHSIVLGDKDANQEGLVDKVESHRKYISTDKPNPFIKELTANEIWKIDQERLDSLQKMGYDILVIWESDYKENKEKIINKTSL